MKFMYREENRITLVRKSIPRYMGDWLVMLYLEVHEMEDSVCWNIQMHEPTPRRLSVRRIQVHNHCLVFNALLAKRMPTIMLCKMCF